MATNETISKRNEKISKFWEYLIYLAIFGAIISLISIRKNYILAPPYAVSAYLIVFQRRTKYSSRSGIIASYLFVILSSYILHILFSQSILGMVLNVIAVSALITFTGFTHPPAIALTIFSYLDDNIIDFTISTLLALIILVVSSLLIDQYD
ncbi:MAG: HPP family protein [Candidatus Parvarchaeota archaeon]